MDDEEKEMYNGVYTSFATVIELLLMNLSNFSRIHETCDQLIEVNDGLFHFFFILQFFEKK